MRKLSLAAALIVVLAASSACGPSNEEIELKYIVVSGKLSQLNSRCPFFEISAYGEGLISLLAELEQGENFGSNREWMDLADTVEEAIDVANRRLGDDCRP